MGAQIDFQGCLAAGMAFTRNSAANHAEVEGRRLPGPGGTTPALQESYVLRRAMALNGIRALPKIRPNCGPPGSCQANAKTGTSSQLRA